MTLRYKLTSSILIDTILSNDCDVYVTEPVNKFLVTLNPTTVGSTGFEPESNVKYK
jgi:hypothetical protein